MNKKTILIGLNEINFEFLDYYIAQGELKHFKRLFSASERVETVSEQEYHLLEPWIQWVTIHTGQSYAEHNIYRLGDIAQASHLSQIFEELESAGKSVGAMSPFNAANWMEAPAFFVPDPWTETAVSGSGFIKRLYKAIRQAVNDNAKEKISFYSLLTLGSAFLFYVPITNWASYLRNIVNRKKPGTKAIILDSLLSDVFIKIWKKHQPDFANLFLNSGAHIQHHYMFNSAAYQGDLKNPEWYCPQGYDPFIKVLKVYDKILGKLLDQKNVTIYLATGLHQQPHEHLTYYWRLKNHDAFLRQIGIEDHSAVLPRMSRDFLLEFPDKDKAAIAEKKLVSLKCRKEGETIFEIDNRGTSLFIELVYPHELDNDKELYSEQYDISLPNFRNHVSFVAIKNGEHNGIGYLVSNRPMKVSGSIPLTEVKDILKDAVLLD